MTFIGSLTEPALFPWIAFAIGAAVGSFLNVVIHRLPKMMEREWAAQCAELRGETVDVGKPYSIARPRSHCPACGHQITVFENIPLLSWLWLRAKCSACGARISVRYPLIELAAGVIGVYCAVRFGPGIAAIAAMVFLWAILAASAIDIDTQLLPDSITLPLLWLGLLVNISGTFVDLRSAVIGAAAGYLILWSVYWAFKIATGKEGMGFGDFKLLAAIGAWCGWQSLPLTILASSLIGAIVGVALIIIARRGKNVPIPFGPYLGAAGALSLLWGPQLTRQWLEMI